MKMPPALLRRSWGPCAIAMLAVAMIAAWGAPEIGRPTPAAIVA